ncbi:methyltransferase-like protein 4 isoform X2 [Agrilus planipennis]|uniref:Methyltransferase-like protein 4 isoform X2 n=1 Tax=Agrilus planipennis TaxID=224129 RepID=A0A1W4XQ76_AGRPL|nr:methyltransferase-like protein 4 isoform X2 [Agrilus planipennis]
MSILSTSSVDKSSVTRNNVEATDSAEQIYKNSGKILNKVFGKNVRSDAIVASFNNDYYLFPPNCEFFSKDICELPSVIGDRVYDLILLDPPWWNKYIRRKRSKNKKAAYTMIYNEDLKKLPLENMISDHGIVVVWCTNSNKHQTALLNDIFMKWQVKFYTKWYWIKITCSGAPICSFSKPPRKQPFEQIFIATKCASLKIPKSKIIVSVPSALHSHKPPLEEILKEFLPNQPKCLEVFARYLLPKWTSWGLEVLRFQHNSLYITD